MEAQRKQPTLHVTLNYLLGTIQLPCKNKPTWIDWSSTWMQ